MKLRYYPETDSLYISLSEEPAIDAVEVSDGLVADVDADGRVVGLDIEHAASRLDLTTIEAIDLPLLPRAR